MDENTESPIESQRALAAIVFTDIVDYSGLMAKDESRTFQLLRRDMQWMKDVCIHHGGTVVKSTGDGLMLHFVSVNASLSFALDVQKGLVEMSDTMEPDQVLQHRMGVHLGDVFVMEDDVIGEGVNLASRIMEEAEPNGIAISGVVYEMMKGQLPSHTIFLGERELKHIPGTIPVYLIRAQPPETKAQPPVESSVPSAPLKLQLIAPVKVAQPEQKAAKEKKEQKVMVQRLQDGRLSAKGPYLTLHRWAMEATIKKGLTVSTTNPEDYGFDAVEKSFFWGETKIPVRFYLMGMTYIIDLGNAEQFAKHPKKIRETILGIQALLLAEPPVPKPEEATSDIFLTKYRPPALSSFSK